MLSGTKLNKLVFSGGLVVLGAIYGYAITPLYRKNKTAAAIIDG